MATLRDIRRRITAVKNTEKITSAMKMISAVKLKRAQKAIESARPYVLKLEDMLSNLISAVGDDYSHPLTQKPKDIKSITLIAIAAERGLCGSFNSNLFRFVNSYINEKTKIQYPDAEVSIVAVGQRSYSFFKKTDLQVLKEFKGVFKKLNFTSAKDIVNAVKNNFVEGKTNKVLFFYNEFINVIRQVQTVNQLLPIEPKEQPEEEKTTVGGFKSNYIFEPDKESILNELLPKLIDIKIWRALLESNAAEQAARMMAMDNATTNANELVKHLELVFNKARQAAITKEMLEIVSGAEALKKE